MNVLKNLGVAGACVLALTAANAVVLPAQVEEYQFNGGTLEQAPWNPMGSVFSANFAKFDPAQHPGCKLTKVRFSVVMNTRGKVSGSNTSPNTDNGTAKDWAIITTTVNGPGALSNPIDLGSLDDGFELINQSFTVPSGNSVNISAGAGYSQASIFTAASDLAFFEGAGTFPVGMYADSRSEGSFEGGDNILLIDTFAGGYVTVKYIVKCEGVPEASHLADIAFLGLLGLVMPRFLRK